MTNEKQSLGAWGVTVLETVCSLSCLYTVNEVVVFCSGVLLLEGEVLANKLLFLKSNHWSFLH